MIKIYRMPFYVLLFCGFLHTTNCGRMIRSLDQFAKMITLTTGRNALDFSDYGNFCGLGGSGKTVDEIDQCCKTHDECYDSIETNLSHSYFNGYQWHIKNHTIHCDETDPRRLAVCICDRNAAFCFGDNIKFFNEANIGNFGNIVTNLFPGFSAVYL